MDIIIESNVGESKMRNNIDEICLKFLNDMSSNIVLGKRKKIKTDELEKQIKRFCGGLEGYRNQGGYEAFANSFIKCLSSHLLSEIKNSTLNKRTPPLKESYWLNGTKQADTIEAVNFFLTMGDLFNLESYKMNKNLLTRQECLKIERVYHFLKNDKKTSETVLREERSLMLFYDLDTGDIEPEKYLSSSKGKAFLSRIGLDVRDLNCEVIREPYKYWKHQQVSFNDIQTVLIVEGLATFHTFKKILNQNIKWPFSLKPELLIFGGGKRILSSFEYTEELFFNRKDMSIFYFGDLDPEGYTIYSLLKERYADYTILLEAECYQFMLENTREYATTILKEQRFDVRSFKVVSQELGNTFPSIKKTLDELWQKKLRIAQEALNLHTILCRKE